MPRLLNYLAPLYVWLYSLDPALPQALFVSMVFLSVWLLRKLAPNQWEWFANLIFVKSDDLSWWQNELRQVWQALPAAMIGTLYGILGTGADPIPTLKAAGLALLAPVVHRVASRYQGKVGAEKPKGGGDGGTMDETVERPGYNDVSTPPGTSMRLARRFELVTTGLAVFTFCFGFTACSPAGWQAQRDAANVVADVSNKTILPVLKAADEATGKAAVDAQPTNELAQHALSVHREQWKPLWNAWDVFAEAQDAWQDTIEAKGDPLATALAARLAFCRLATQARAFGVKLPPVPLGGSCS